MTANALPEQVRAFRQAGMDDYVAKPFKQSDLHDAIRRVAEFAVNPRQPEIEQLLSGGANHQSQANGQVAVR